MPTSRAKEQSAAAAAVRRRPRPQSRRRERRERRSTAGPAPVTAEGRVKASPAARKMAAERGVALAAVGAGSGPGGRILSTDRGDMRSRRGATAAATDGGGEIRRPLSKMRRAIGAQPAAIEADGAAFLRADDDRRRPAAGLLSRTEVATNCTLNDVIVLAVGRAMREFPAVRSQIVGNEIVEYPHANIGIAVGVDDGLVVPVVLDVDTLSLAPAGRRDEARRRTGPQGPAGKHRQRPFHDQQPRHVRRRGVQRDHQSAGIRHSGRERGPRGGDRRKRRDASRPQHDDDAQRRPSHRRRRDGGEVHGAAERDSAKHPAGGRPRRWHVDRCDGKQVADALDACVSWARRTKSVRWPTAATVPTSPPRVNAHIHLPPNFSAFDSVEQAVTLAADEHIGVLGVSNYYDYDVYGEFVERARGTRHLSAVRPRDHLRCRPICATPA